MADGGKQVIRDGVRANRPTMVQRRRAILMTTMFMLSLLAPAIATAADL